MADQTKTQTWKTPEETKIWAHELAAQLTRPALVLFSGDVGAGKTQIVRWIVEALGGAHVSSPTFAIHQRYETPQGPVDHADLYRLKSDADLESSGFWDLFSETDNLIFVEWADRLPDSSWPKDRLTFKLDVKVEAATDIRTAKLFAKI